MILKQILQILTLHVVAAMFFKIKREELGDEFPYFPCKQGTIIVENDATHSLKCTNTLQQAGCDLSFNHSNRVGFIPGNTRKIFYIKPNKNIYPYQDAFCSVNYKPNVGEIYLQDYPSNIYENVWSNAIGSKVVNQTFIYKTVKENKIVFEISTNWPGLLVRIHIDCLDERGIIDSPMITRRCVMVKFGGETTYPITEGIFKNLINKSTIAPTSTTTTTTTISTTSKVVFGAITNDIGNPYFIAIATSISLGLLIFVVYMAVTYCCLRCTNRNKRQLTFNNPSSESVIDLENTVSRLSYKEMDTSPIINLNTSKYSTNSKTRMPMNGPSKAPVRLKSSMVQGANIAAMDLTNSSLNNSDEFFENKYTPPFEFNKTAGKQGQRDFSSEDGKFYFNESRANSDSRSNRGKIRQNIPTFEAFESPMNENNLKDIIQSTPDLNKLKQIDLLNGSNENINYDDNGDVLTSETQNILDEINKAYTSFGESLKIQRQKLKPNLINNDSISFDSPSKVENGDTSSDTIDAMFALDEDEDTLGESQEIALDFSAGTDLRNSSTEQNELKEEVIFKPYSFHGDSQVTSNPLYKANKSLDNDENNHISNDVFF